MNVGSATAGVAQAQQNARDILANAGRSAGKQQADDAAASDPYGAATNVDLSPQAKAAMAGQKNDQAAIDMLNQNDPTKGLAPDFSHDEIIQSGVAEASADDSDNPLKAIPPEQMAAQHKETAQILMVSAAAHLNPEGGAALREAFANGTVKFFKADNVPGVNMTVDRDVSAPGEPFSESIRTTANYSPEVQAMVDSGHAMTTYMKGVGGVYMTW